jgi:hypothetical protein
MEAFEEALKDKKFNLVDMNYEKKFCKDCKDAKTAKVTLYYQSSSDDMEWCKAHPKSGDYDWWKFERCEGCFKNALSDLDYNGHYLNVRIFDSDGRDITEKNNATFHPLDPDELVHVDEDIDQDGDDGDDQDEEQD